MISTVSHVVRLLRGCGEKMTASRHLMANIPTPGGVSSGFVVGTSDAIRPTGLAYLAMPFSGTVSITPTLGCRRTSRRMPMTLKRLLIRLSGSPMPLSSTPIWARRVNVVSLATAQATAWQSRSTCSWVAPSNSRSAARARSTSSSTCAVSSGVIGRVPIQTNSAISSRGRGRAAPRGPIIMNGGPTSGTDPIVDVASTECQPSPSDWTLDTTRPRPNTFLLYGRGPDMRDARRRRCEPRKRSRGSISDVGDRSRPHRELPDGSRCRGGLRSVWPHQHLPAGGARARRSSAVRDDAARAGRRTRGRRLCAGVRQARRRAPPCRAGHDQRRDRRRDGLVRFRSRSSSSPATSRPTTRGGDRTRRSTFVATPTRSRSTSRS